MKLPLRFRILHLLSIEKISMSKLEIMAKLRPEYGDEGQFKESMVELHLQSMRAVGLVEAVDLSLDATDHLQVKYKITEYGFSRLSYLPTEWKHKAS